MKSIIVQIAEEIVWQESGIVPMRGFGSPSLTKTLADMSEDESKKTKRKFRKTWRKAVKSELKKETRSAARMAKNCGFRKEEPNTLNKKHRRELVKRVINLRVRRVVDHLKGKQER